MLKWFWKRKTKLRSSILVILVLKVVKSLSMKIFAAALSTYLVNTKRYNQRNGLMLSGLAMVKSKSELNLNAQFLKLLIFQICRNYFQAMISKFKEIYYSISSLIQGFWAYICRIHAKTGLRTLPLLGWTSLWY